MLDRELVERHVTVERVYDPIAVRTHGAAGPSYPFVSA